MEYLVVSTSLNPHSNSRTMARHAHATLQERGGSAAWLDLQDLRLPLCDATSCYADPNTHELHRKIGEAKGVLLGVSVYNYNVNAAAKNVIELAGKALEDRVVGFLCAAGGRSGYMSVLGLANSLMLDFRCVIVPRFVYATRDAFTDGALQDDTVRDRVETCADDLMRMTTALHA